jgi:hypothetical protein
MVTQNVGGISQQGSFNIAKGSFNVMNKNKFANQRNQSNYSAKPIM